MSNTQAPQSDSHAQKPELAPQMSAGALLRQAREAAGLHIAALAVSLKVPVKKLEALEADQLDLLPDAVFARALASSVCRTLKTDPAPILACLPQTIQTQLHSKAMRINTPLRSPGQDPRLTPLGQLSRPVVIAALVLVVGALVLVLLPSVERSVGALGPASARPAPVAPPQVAMEPVTQSAPVDAGAQAALIASTSLVASNLPAGARLDGATVTPSLPAEIAPTGALAAEPGAPANTGIVVIKTRATSWVEVTDARAVVQLRKTMGAGETVGASGSLPLLVIVGRADTTEVQVRGKPFDLAPLTKNNVARFEVR